MINSQTQNNIMLINKLGFNVAMIKFGAETEFFIFSSFESSQTSSSVSIDYCSMRGIIITDFVSIDRVDFGSESVFNSNFTSYLTNKSELNIKFNKNIEYVLFTT